MSRNSIRQASAIKGSNNFGSWLTELPLLPVQGALRGLLPCERPSHYFSSSRLSAPLSSVIPSILHFSTSCTSLSHHFRFPSTFPPSTPSTHCLLMAPPKQRDLASSRWKQESKHIVLWPMSIGFGVRVGENSMKVMKNVAPVGTSILRLELNTESRIITAYFPLLGRTDVWNGTREFKLTIDVRQMRSTYCTELNGTFSLVLPLHFPPQYYWKSEISRNIGGAMHRYADGWSRATDVAMDMDASRGSPVALHNPVADPEYIDIGRWTTLRFILDAGTPESNRMIHTFCSALEDLNVACQAVSVFKILPKSEPLIWGRLDHPPITSTGALDLLERTSNVIHLEFSVRYQLEVCISRGWLNDHAVSEDFLLRLAAMDPIKARLCLEVLADQGKVLSNPMDLFDNPDTEAYVSNTRLPHYCALIRKAIVTPTTIRLNTPSAETSNRVIRKYNLIQDRFLRVQFLEESERGRIGASKPEHDKIYERLRRTMHQGIRIGERRYEFLAFGSSQLRECGAYFFCPTDGTSCDDIRRWMGQFDHIRVVAKYAARVGQCLSTTREIRSIHVPRIREASDVERNGHCFTDGVGVISGFLSRLIMEELAMDVFVEPSAFQFRMGGCKGVLAVWPQARGMEVQIRKSQEKFKAEFNGLEIIRCAKLATATLNRQTITILESLGVSQSAFLDLLDHQLHLFEKATEDTGIAIQLLTQLIDENQVTLIISEILKANFLSESSKEPFVANVLNLWRSWSLKLLKEKARIQVEQSAFVLGCVDETGSLRGHSSATEGCKIKDVSMLPQIFLQLSDPKIYNQTRIVQGVCIVGRNPSLHPGDIRVVEAVDEPKLRHLKDVVVFPSTGDRPLPNMLSGGDLDGDDFFVIWDPSLIPNEWNHPPMNYSGSKPCELQRDVNVDDMRDFFVSYVKNDVLPCVATAHLGFADNLGPKSPICK